MYIYIYIYVYMYICIYNSLTVKQLPLLYKQLPLLYKWPAGCKWLDSRGQQHTPTCPEPISTIRRSAKETKCARVTCRATDQTSTPVYLCVTAHRATCHHARINPPDHGTHKNK